jgi:nicotinamide-nucleotide amidase
MRRRLVRDPVLLERIRRRLRHLPAAARRYNLARQAQVVSGAKLLPNPVGTAPGQWLRRGRHHLILLPGVPAELHAIWENEVAPRLRRAAAPEVARLRTLGLAESEVDLRLRELARRFKRLEITTLAQRGQVDVYVSRKGLPLAPVVRRARLLLGDALFAEGDRELSEVIGAELMRRRMTLAVAESCSGGRLSEMITAVAGASNYFQGGVVAYGNQAKREVLDLPERMLEEHGAVSAPVAKAMARGAKTLLRADLGLGITGIAGPAGATPDKPVGLVYVALAASRRSQVEELHLRGTRQDIQRQSALMALRQLWRYLRSR